MVPQSPKRRKLDHSHHPGASNNDEFNGESRSVSTKAGIVTVVSTRDGGGEGKRPRDVDESALYAGDLYKSSMFKLQVGEMLSEIQPNYGKRLGPVSAVLHRLKTLIENIKDQEPMKIAEATRLMQKSHKITIPFPDPKPDDNAAYMLEYSRPSDINIVGSYALKTMTKGDDLLSVDMVVTMPVSILQPKDYLNYRYFYKRAYFLACIAAGISQSAGKDYDLVFDLLNGNSLQPVIVVKAGKGPNAIDFSASKCHIRIIPAAPEGFFLESKLLPNKNAIRPVVGNESEVVSPRPTPFYNATLRVDSNFAQYLKLLHYASKQADGFKDSCILGRTWLRQRGFGSSISAGGFGPFEWAAVTALLLQSGGAKDRSLLSPGYSSYQLFKAVVQFLASTNMAAKPILLRSADIDVPKSGTPTFYDGTRGLNILFKMTASSYALLLEEAKLSLETLNDLAFDQFEATFILRKDHPLLQFDSIFEIPAISVGVDNSKQDHSDNHIKLAQKLYDVLREGLNDRVSIIHVRIPETRSWSLNSAVSSPVSGILVGVVFDPANIDRVVDHGPAAEETKKAVRFQKFWGEKAELRRFKDGSILESLIWSSATTGSVFRDIITFLVKRHLSSVATFVSEEIPRLISPPSTSAKAFDALKVAYNTFENDIRNLESLPLQLRQLAAISPQLRLSSVHPPLFNPRQHMQDPADVLIQFEGSGRWPDDVGAIQRTKVAFLIKIGELLQESVPGLISKLSLENSDHHLLNCASLDVIYSSGAVFRLRIQNDREQTLLDRQIKDKSVDSHKKDEAVSAMSAFKRMYTQLPLHTQSVATHCTRFPLLSPTIRLVKKWFQSHLLADHFREELIELLVVRIFLQPYPWRAPSSPMTGLLRTLQFISRWDWRMTPLIVDFGGTMNIKDVASINTRLEAWRKIDPAMSRVVLFAASNHDTSGISFSDSMPSKVVAARMTALARSACAVVREQDLKLDAEALFHSSVDDYDFVIHMSPAFVGDNKGKLETKSPKYKNLEVQSEEDLAFIGYEPLDRFLDELRSLYTSSIIFFHDNLTGSIITGLWNPQTSSRPFKVNLPYAVKPVVNEASQEEGENVEIDKSAILAEIARLGGDMVLRVKLNR